MELHSPRFKSRLDNFLALQPFVDSFMSISYLESGASHPGLPHVVWPCESEQRDRASTALTKPHRAARHSEFFLQRRQGIDMSCQVLARTLGERHF